MLGSQILITGAVRRLARPDPRLCRHRLARPRGVLRHRRLHGGTARRARLAASRCRVCSPRRSSPAAAGYLVSFLVVRGGDLTRLMVTLGIGLMLWEAANKARSITGGVDGLSRRRRSSKILGVFGFDIGGTYCVPLRARRRVPGVRARRGASCNSPFGLSLRGIREGGKRMPAIGAPVAARLRAIFTIGAAVAGIAGALLAQTTQFVGIDTLGFPRSAELLIMLVLGGTGRLYGGLVGAAIFMIAQDYLSGINPGVLAVLDRLLPGRHRAVRARRHPGRPRQRLRARSVAERRQRERRAANAGPVQALGRVQRNSDVSLTFAPGARHALIGPNGAGKTTFINLLTGVFPPTAGHGVSRRREHHRAAAARSGSSAA